MKNPFAKGKIRVTQTYKSGHLAMDLVGVSTREVVALEDATVVQSRIVTDHSNLTWTYGNYIIYKLASGKHILCAHLAERKVKVGDRVSKGQVIGIEGTTGNSTGIHLHIEYRDKDGTTRLNVAEYLGIPNSVGTYDPGDAPEPTDLHVVLQAWVDGYGWLPEVDKCDDTPEGYAGIGKLPIKAFRCRLSDWSALHYRGRRLNGRWFQEVDRWSDEDNGYAGNKKDAMDYAMAWSARGHRIALRVKTEKHGWCSWIYHHDINDKKNGVAGYAGEPIIGIQMKLY